MKIRALFCAGLLLSFLGCGSDPDTSGSGPVACARACAADQVCQAGLCVYQATESLLYVVATASVPLVDQNGSVVGYNLDGEISAATDEEGCGVTDATSPTGVEGVDNLVANVITDNLGLIEGALMVDVDEVISQVFTNGEYYFGVLIEPQGDTFQATIVSLEPANGAPTIVNDVIVPGQAFRITGNISQPQGGFRRNPSTSVVRLELDQLRLSIPPAVYDIIRGFIGDGFQVPADLALTVENAIVSLDISTDSPSTVIGLAVRESAILDIIEGFDQTVVGMIQPFVNLFLRPDLRLDGAAGDCNAISAGVEITLVEASVAE